MLHSLRQQAPDAALREMYLQKRLEDACLFFGLSVVVGLLSVLLSVRSVLGEVEQVHAFLFSIFLTVAFVSVITSVCQYTRLQFFRSEIHKLQTSGQE